MKAINKNVATQEILKETMQGVAKKTTKMKKKHGINNGNDMKKYHAGTLDILLNREIERKRRQ